MLEQDPTVTICFAGLEIFCISKKNEFQAAVVQCPDHKLVINVQEITLDENGEPIESKLLSHSLDEQRNIKVTAEKPGTSGVEKYENRSLEFDPERDLGDPKDFRWIIDLEGEKFGGQKLELKPHHSVAMPKKLGPVITVSHGKVYTEKRSDEKFAVISVNNGVRQPEFLGRIAHRIGVDIRCDDQNGGAVSLSNAGGKNSLSLKAEPNKRYLITFDNLCPPSDELRGGTDFRYIFDAVSNQNGEQFDLQRVVENGGRGNSDEAIAGHPDFSLDAQEQPCQGGNLGQGDGFPPGGDD
jgi:hypothetical protein